MKKSKLEHLGNCLVTGGTGYIGSRLIKYLVSNHVQVRVLSRNSIQDVETILCDFEKEEIPSNALDSIDTIYHLAGLSKDIGNYQKLEKLYKKINVDVATNLAKLAMISNVKCFVHVSSVKAAGKISIKQGCATERDVGELTGVYAKSKREAEIRLLNLVKDSDMHLSILRPSMVYGPNIGGNIGSMLSGIKKGWFPPLPETGNRKSMVHVRDLIRAMIFVADNKRANKEIYNVTDGFGYSSRNMYTIIRRAQGLSNIRWSVPISVFKNISKINPFIEKKY